MSIIKTNNRVTVGANTNVSQVFYANKFVPHTMDDGLIVLMKTPIYEPTFGTRSFLLQSPKSIMPNFSSPYINYKFTADTGGLSAITFFHEIYKLDFKIWNDYLRCYNYENMTEEGKREGMSNDSRETTTKTVKETGNSGIQTIKTIEETTEKNIQDNQHYISNCPSFEDIQEKLTTPIATFTGDSSTIASDSYPFIADDFVKNQTTKKTERLFEDRGQYLINFTMEQIKTFDNDFKDFYYFSEDNEIILGTIPTQVELQTKNDNYTIEDGPLKDIVINGEFFTYFILPNRPKLETPLVSGTLNTFTPEFFWSNTEDSDHQIIQMTYAVADTGFTGTVFTYDVRTENLNNSEEILKTQYASDGWSENIKEDIAKTIKAYSVPLKPNLDFRCRIGNIKELEKNIFGVSQQVITFSQSYTATTVNINLDKNVYISIDSPFFSGVSTTPALTSSDLCSEGTLSLSGMTSGSTVTGATMQLYYPSGNYITTPTDITGYFEFDSLVSGNYILLTHYRGYEVDSTSFTLTADTYVNINLKLLWSNDVDTFGKMANETFNYY